MMNGFETGQHNSAPNSTSASNNIGGTQATLHIKREPLNGSTTFVDDGSGVNGSSTGNNSANHSSGQIASVSSVGSSASDRMRSSSSEPQIHSGISSTTPVWSTSVHHPAYDFDVYASQLNGNLGSTSCCLNPSNGNGPSLSHSHLTQNGNSYSAYYASSAATAHESSTATAASRPCKPAATKFWSNSYDSVNGSSPQMSSDHSSIMAAAAVCHPSAFAAAAAHHAANHIAASAWCSYPTYTTPASRADPYLSDSDPRSFVDSAYAHHTAMRMSATSEQSCAGAGSAGVGGGSTSVTSWTQPANGGPPSTNNSTSKC